MHTTYRPQTDLHPQFSDPAAEAVTWEVARAELAAAEIFWITTVRPDGRPHVTPLLAVWLDGSLHVCTGPDERKALNLVANPHCVLTTGCNAYDEGLDLVVEGEAVPVTYEPTLRRLAAAWLDKYGEEWRFEVRDDAFWHEAGGRALVFAVRPTTAFGFARGIFGQTRWRF